MITIHIHDTYLSYDTLSQDEKEEISKSLTLQAMTHVGYIPREKNENNTSKTKSSQNE